MLNGETFAILMKYANQIRVFHQNCKGLPTRVLGKKLFNLNSVKRHLIQVAQPVGRVKFTWGSQLTGSEALWEFLV